MALDSICFLGLEKHYSCLSNDASVGRDKKIRTKHRSMLGYITLTVYCLQLVYSNRILKTTIVSDAKTEISQVIVAYLYMMT